MSCPEEVNTVAWLQLVVSIVLVVFTIGFQYWREFRAARLRRVSALLSMRFELQHVEMFFMEMEQAFAEKRGLDLSRAIAKAERKGLAKRAESAPATLAIDALRPEETGMATHAWSVLNLFCFEIGSRSAEDLLFFEPTEYGGWEKLRATANEAKLNTRNLLNTIDAARESSGRS